MLFLGRSIPVQVDDAGRSVLPKDLRAAMGIGADALFMGVGESFQIWAPEAHAAEVAALLDDDDGGDALLLMPWAEAGA